MDMLEEPFCVEIYGKNAAHTFPGTHFVWKFKGKKAQAQVTGAILWLPGITFWMEVEAHVARAILYGNLQEKCRSRISRPPFCVEIYRKKRTWTCQKSNFVWKFTGKMPHPHFQAHTLCGNLQDKTRMDIAHGPFCMEIYRKNAADTFPGTHFVWKFTGKNAHGQCTRVILCGNLQEKCRTPPCPPRSNTGPLSLTVRTPSVWPHCLGKNKMKPTNPNAHTHDINTGCTTMASVALESVQN